MAKDGDDYQYWLLPEFLVHGGDGGGGGELSKKNCDGRFGAQFVDDDSCFTEVTREFAQSSSVRKSSYGFEDEKVWGSSGSPASALSTAVVGGARGGNRCFSCSGSPRGVTRSDAALELLHAAVEEITRLRMVEEAALFQRSMKKPSPVSVPGRIPCQNPLQQSYQQELNAFQFQMLRQQLEVTQKKLQFRQTQRVAVNGGERKQIGSLATVSGSGARTAFHGNPAAKKRECAGTGVFLPRGVVSSPAPPRKKHGSSTVLGGGKTPAARQPKYGGWAKGPDGEAVPPRFRAGSDGSGARQHSEAVDELQLPQEWTY